MPGRGEPIRLAFEQSGATYEDVALAGKDGAKEVMKFCSPEFKCPGPSSFPTFLPGTVLISPAGSISPFAPPILQHGSVILSQLPNIMLYLGPKLGLVPDDDELAKYKVNQVFLTACDLQNEAHDVQ